MRRRTLRLLIPSIESQSRKLYLLFRLDLIRLLSVLSLSLQQLFRRSISGKGLLLRQDEWETHYRDHWQQCVVSLEGERRRLGWAAHSRRQTIRKKKGKTNAAAQHANICALTVFFGGVLSVVNVGSWPRLRHHQSR